MQWNGPGAFAPYTPGNGPPASPATDDDAAYSANQRAAQLAAALRRMVPDATPTAVDPHARLLGAAIASRFGLSGVASLQSQAQNQATYGSSDGGTLPIRPSTVGAFASAPQAYSNSGLNSDNSGFRMAADGIDGSLPVPPASHLDPGNLEGASSAGGVPADVSHQPQPVQPSYAMLGRGSSSKGLGPEVSGIPQGFPSLVLSPPPRNAPPEADGVPPNQPLETDRWGRDTPGAYVRAVRDAVLHPRPGTSDTATDEWVARHPEIFAELIRQGVGSTIFGNSNADRYSDNSFDIGKYPEESTVDPNDWTYHKYGVLTYAGPVDEYKGITKPFLEQGVIQGRYSGPGRGLTPLPANFSGRSDVYAVSPWDAIADKGNLDRPEKYTYRIGAIEQMKVRDGVLNITTEDHQVYPATIRRTAVEVGGHLFILTSGAGVNRMNNSGSGDLTNPLEPVRKFPQISMALGNDTYGPLAFRALDRQAVNYINQIRNRAAQ